MRCFIAIDLPVNVKEELVSAQKQLSPAAAKMSLAHDFHLTLKFLGEITPAKVDAVKSLLANVKFKSFAARLAGIGAFPSQNAARVVWVGLEPEESLIELQQMVDDTLRSEFKIEKGFKPHITLTRVKLVSDKERFVKQLQQVKTKTVEFRVESFKLKSSTLSSQGAIYEDLAVFNSGSTV